MTRRRLVPTQARAVLLGALLGSLAAVFLPGPSVMAAESPIPGEGTIHGRFRVVTSQDRLETLVVPVSGSDGRVAFRIQYRQPTLNPLSIAEMVTVEYTRLATIVSRADGSGWRFELGDADSGQLASAGLRRVVADGLAAFRTRRSSGAAPLATSFDEGCACPESSDSCSSTDNPCEITGNCGSTSCNVTCKNGGNCCWCNSRFGMLQVLF